MVIPSFKVVAFLKRLWVFLYFYYIHIITGTTTTTTLYINEYIYRNPQQKANQLYPYMANETGGKALTRI